jgi:hypothetical protein
MAKNYLSLEGIVEKNKGKIATYEMESYTEGKSAVALLSFENGDKIKFYHYQDCAEYTEGIFF